MDFLKNALIVGCGGFLGSSSRYLFGSLLASRLSGEFPASTFIINVLGSFLIGIVLQLSISNSAVEPWKLFLAVGVLGGFTTYSAFAYEALKLFSDKAYFSALIYVFGTSILAIAGCFLGIVVARQFQHQ